MSLKARAIKAVFWSALEQFGNKLVGFIISTMLARLLMPEEFGLIAMLSIFIGLASVLIDSGLTQSLIRTNECDTEDLSTVFYFNIIISIIVYFIFYLIAPFVSTYFEQPALINIIRVYSIVFIINSFSAVQKTILTKSLDFKTLMFATMPSLFLYGLVGIFLAINGFGVWSLVWAAIAQSIAVSIQLWLKSTFKPILIFNIVKFKYHFNFGYKLLLSGLLETIFSNSYTFIIGKLYAPSQVGFYSKSNNLQMLPVQLITSVLTKITYPLFSEIQNDNIRLKKIFKRLIQIVILIVAPTLVFSAILATPIFRLLYTEKWLPAVPYFQILCIAGILFPLHSFNLHILNVKGRSELFLKLEIFKKIIILVAIFISIQYGLLGLLYGNVITSILSFFINSYYSGKFINYNSLHQIKDMMPILLITLISGFIVFLTDILINSYHDIIRILVGGFIGIFSLFVLLALLKISAYEDFKSIVMLRGFKINKNI